MPYRLFFGEVLLGEVEPTDADFPSLWGTFRPSGAADRPEVRAHIADYVAFCEAADRLMMDDGDEEGWEAYIEEHESRFLDLIESAEWWLEDDRGEQLSILVPNFCRDSTVVWRWDFGRDPGEAVPGR